MKRFERNGGNWILSAGRYELDITFSYNTHNKKQNTYISYCLLHGELDMKIK